MAQTSVIQGFFNVVNPLLIDRAAQQLGVTSTLSSGAGTNPSSGTSGTP
jgi:hypothetical protein